MTMNYSAVVLSGAVVLALLPALCLAQCVSIDNIARTHYTSRGSSEPVFDIGFLANGSEAFKVGTGENRIHGLRVVLSVGCNPGSMLLTVVGLRDATVGLTFASKQNEVPWDTDPLGIPPGDYRLDFTSYSSDGQQGTAVDGQSFFFNVGLSGTFFDVYNDIGMGNHPSTTNEPHTALTLFDCNDDGYPDLLANTPYRIVYSDTSARGLRFAADLRAVDTDLNGGGYRGIAWGDFDNDGRVDVVTARNADVQTQVVPGTCNQWKSSWKPEYYNNDEAVMFADVNGDGHLDVFDAGQPFMWFDGAVSNANNSLVIFFPGISSYPWVDGTNTEGSTSADFNGDGFPDFMWTDGVGTHVVLNMKGEIPFQYSAHATAGEFGLPETVSDHEYVSWAWGDCDNDGFLDLVLLGDVFSGFFKNLGTGRFEAIPAADSGLNLRSGVAFKGDWGDFDGDGDLDFFLVRDDYEAEGGLYVNNGDCTFERRAGWIPSSMIRTNATNKGYGREPFDLSDLDDETTIAGDVDADGRLDVIHSDGYILYNRGEPAPGKANFQVQLVGLGSDGNSPVTPMGATVRVYDSSSHVLLSHRELISSTNQLQPFWVLHVGALPSDQPVDIVAWFPSSQRHKIYRQCRIGNLSFTFGTINGGVVYSPALKIVEPSASAATLTTIPSSSARSAEIVWCGCDSAGQPGGPITDACGVCDGDGSSCRGCDGVLASNKKLDECGVCGGNGSTCIGCDGSPGTGKILDVNSSCSGCDGVLNSGLVLDRCGVCGGNGSTCTSSSTGSSISAITSSTGRSDFSTSLADLTTAVSQSSGSNNLLTSSVSPLSPTPSLPIASSTTSSGMIGDLLLFIILGAACFCCVGVGVVACIVFRKRRRHGQSNREHELQSVVSSPPTVYEDLALPPIMERDYSDLPGLTYSRESVGEYSNFPSGSLALANNESVGNYSNFSARSPVTLKSKPLTRNQWEIAFEDIVFGEKIGSGSFGVVYAGFWRAAPVAIKSLSAARTSQRDIDDFKSEAQLMSTLRPHTNVVQFQGMASDTGTLYLLTEFCSGGSLYVLLHSSEEISLSQKIAFAKGIAAAMLHLSSEGIVHRDLAARNVLLSESRTVKVGDFGMSRLVEGAEGATTQSNVGPLKWMAKESLIERIYSEKSDVYAFGVTVFEIASRCEPHAGTPGFQVATRMASEATRPILESVANVSPQLQDVIERCTAYSPAQRPSFAELTKRLADF